MTEAFNHNGRRRSDDEQDVSTGEVLAKHDRTVSLNTEGIREPIPEPRRRLKHWPSASAASTPVVSLHSSHPRFHLKRGYSYTASVSSSSNQTARNSFYSLANGSVSRFSGRPHALLRRTSSFGGAPLVVLPDPLPIAAAPLTQSPGYPPRELVPDHLLEEGVAELAEKTSWRWIVLALSCCLLFGNYYAYDNPASLNTFLQHHLPLSHKDWQFVLSLFYSVYSLPNTILPLLGGTLLDRYDPRAVLLIFSGFVCLGQTLFALGTQSTSVPTMIVGRVLFGIGGETVSVIQSWIVAGWFKHLETAFALGLTLCIARLGSVFNSIMSPQIASRFGVNVAVWVGSATCIFSFGCAIVLCIVMTPFLAKSKETETVAPSESSPELSPKISSPLFNWTGRGITAEPEEREPLLDTSTNSTHIDSTSTYPSLDTSTVPSQTHTQHQSCIPDTIRPSIQRFWQSLVFFPTSFWILSTICILIYGTVVPFNSVVSDFLQAKWYHGDAKTAGFVMSIPDTLSALLVPPLGYLVDKYGRRASLLIFCSFTIMSSHIFLGISHSNPIPAFIALGISYSIYGVAIWPSIASVVTAQEEMSKLSVGDSAQSDDNDEETESEESVHRTKDHVSTEGDDNHGHLGTAYGLSTAALNTALTIFPMLSANVLSWSGTWTGLELFFAGMTGFGGILGVVLWWVDGRNGRVLERGEQPVDPLTEDESEDRIFRDE